MPRLRPWEFPPWATPTVLAILAGIAADQAFDRTAVLADAMDDAGFDDGQWHQSFMLGALRDDDCGAGPYAGTKASLVWAWHEQLIGPAVPPPRYATVACW